MKSTNSGMFSIFNKTINQNRNIFYFSFSLQFIDLLNSLRQWDFSIPEKIEHFVRVFQHNSIVADLESAFLWIVQS